MLSFLVAVLIAVWFYYSAPRSGRPPISWAISGVVVYSLVAVIWTLAITPDVKDAAIHNQSGILVFVTRYAYILAAALAAAAVNIFINKAK